MHLTEMQKTHTQIMYLFLSHADKGNKSVSSLFLFPSRTSRLHHEADSVSPSSSSSPAQVAHFKIRVHPRVRESDLKIKNDLMLTEDSFF